MVAVVGPTASGKTELAIRLAQQRSGELISADSRQIYRGCDIGTNKPTPAELGGVPIHLIDLVDPGEPFTVADFARLGRGVVGAVAARGRLPVLQGGTGLYLRSLLDGWNLGEAPPNPTLRANLERRLQLEGRGPLDAELRAIDPGAADRAQHNPRRLIRALEIYAATGRPPSAVRRTDPPPWTIVMLGLDVPLDVLDRRIEMRVRRMIEQGFVEEVARIRKTRPRADLRLLGHGYPELAAYLDGALSLDEAQQSTIRQVRQYARRQLTWFRADHRVQWIRPEIEAAVAALDAAIMGAEAS